MLLLLSDIHYRTRDISLADSKNTVARLPAEWPAEWPAEFALNKARRGALQVLHKARRRERRGDHRDNMQVIRHAVDGERPPTLLLAESRHHAIYVCFDVGHQERLPFVCCPNDVEMLPPVGHWWDSPVLS